MFIRIKAVHHSILEKGWCKASNGFFFFLFVGLGLVYRTLELVTAESLGTCTVFLPMALQTSSTTVNSMIPDRAEDYSSQQMRAEVTAHISLFTKTEVSTDTHSQLVLSLTLTHVLFHHSYGHFRRNLSKLTADCCPACDSVVGQDFHRWKGSSNSNILSLKSR